tara:strand:+ start:918 stop:1196 length:279 start_codon:yes stop_codon:yes gene_type:complete
MRAIGKYIIVKTSVEAAKASESLEFSESETNKMRGQRAEVILAGSDVQGINTGDIVYYDKARSFDQMIDGKMYTMTRETDIFVVMSSDESLC